MSASVRLDDLPTLRSLENGVERVFHLEDGGAYRTLCERLHRAGFDFPQCLSGMDMAYGLRSVLHLRRLRDQAEVTVCLDVPYDRPQVPSVSDLWGGVEWHEREAYDLVGIRYPGHPDLRRILLEDHWSIHPLQKRYDTGGYLIPEWQPEPWPDWAAIEHEKLEREQEAARKAAEAARVKAAKEPAGASSALNLTDIRSLNANFAEKLQAQGISTVAALAALQDERLEPLATALGLKSPAAIKKWREGASELLKARPAAGVPSQDAGDDLDRLRTLNAAYADKLRAQGVSTLSALAAVADEQLDVLAAAVGLKSAAALKKWREGAQALLAGGGAQASPETSAATSDGEPDAGETQGRKLSDIRTLNANFAGKLEAQGVTTPEALAALSDEHTEALAAALGLKSAAAVKKWREGAKALIEGDSA